MALAERWMRRVLAGLLAASVACSGSSSSSERTGSSSAPIIGGSASSAAQDAVVLVVHATESSNALELCSGTMLAPSLVLTARHCVARVPSLVTCTSDGTATWGATVTRDYAPTEMFVFGGAQ